MITGKEKLFKLITKVENEEEQKEYLKELKDMLEPKIQNKLEAYSLNDILFKNPIEKTITIEDLRIEIKTLKEEVKTLKEEMDLIKRQVKGKEILEESESENEEDINITSRVNYHKWHAYVTLVIKDFKITLRTLIDTGADHNCIREGLIPTKYFEKTKENLRAANKQKLEVKYKLSKAHICIDHICFENTLLLIKTLSQDMILGTPFISQLYPFTVSEDSLRTNILGKEIKIKFCEDIEWKNVDEIKGKETIIIRKKKQINFLNNEINFKRIEEELQSSDWKEKIKEIQEKIEREVCANVPNAFWQRKKHEITLPYEKDFNEKNIPTKARPIQMNNELLEYCRKEIKELLNKGLIRPSKSPWSCSAFYVQNQAEIERGAPRLVINYKPLNKSLRWIRYPIPNKRDLIKRLSGATIFSKFDMKSGYWQIQIKEEDRYKTAFTVPFGHYEWNVMPFGLKNAPSEFQNIMNEIFGPCQNYTIVYIDDVLVFSKSLREHERHLEKFLKIVKENGLVVSAPKMKLFEVKVRFLGYEIYQGTFTPIQRSLEFAKNFPDKILDKTQLQRFLGCVNYVADFIPNIRIICAPLFKRLRKDKEPLNDDMSDSIKKIKGLVKNLPCLGIPKHGAQLIVETDASDLGYGGILKQKLESEQLVRYYSGIWNKAQLNYSTVKKEVLAIVLCLNAFQDDLFNTKFLLRIDCKPAKLILEKDVKNLVSKQIFARWQALLSNFDFDIEFIKGKDNNLPDYLSREFLQGNKLIEEISESKVHGRS